MKSALQTLPILIFLLLPVFCFTQGTLDQTFGDGGKVVIKNFGEGAYEGCGSNSAFVQPNGKIVVAGQMVKTYISPAFGIARYNSNGELDNSFGGNGIIIDTFNVNYLYNEFISTAIQSDKKIIVSGLVQSLNNVDSLYICAARYLPNGALDSSFGKGGNTIIPTELDFITKSIITDDEKIVIAGLKKFSLTNINFVVLRLNKNGVLDSSFGVNGYATTAIANYSYSPGLSNMAIDSNGNFLLGGYINHERNGSINDYLLVRFKTSGAIDTNFGYNGKVIIHSPSNASIIIKDLAIENDNKIIIMTPDFSLTRLSSTGIIDSTFGINGNVVTKFSGINLTSAALVLENSKIIVSGSRLDQYGESISFALVKYNFNGTIDTIFGNKGLVVTPFDQTSGGTSVLLQADNKIIQLGYYGMGHGAVPALARFNNNGTLAVDLISFIAIKKQTSVLLSWQTASAQNSDYFSIERSNDNDRNFKEIGKVKSKSNSHQLQQYSFEDLAPAAGDNYYRLKQFDKDGQASYEKTVVINFNAVLPVTIYPNPVKNLLTLQGLDGNNTAIICIISIKGNVLQKATVKNSNYTLNIQQLPSGNYFIKIDQQGQIQILKFVKQ